jgi:hypothetical protein
MKLAANKFQILQLTETAFLRLRRQNKSDLGAIAGLQTRNRHRGTASVSVGHETGRIKSVTVTTVRDTTAPPRRCFYVAVALPMPGLPQIGYPRHDMHALCLAATMAARHCHGYSAHVVALCTAARQAQPQCRTESPELPEKLGACKGAAAGIVLWQCCCVPWEPGSREEGLLGLGPLRFIEYTVSVVNSRG